MPRSMEIVSVAWRYFAKLFVGTSAWMALVDAGDVNHQQVQWVEARNLKKSGEPGSELDMPVEIKL